MVEVYVNPYTGAILGNSLHPNVVQHFLQIVYQLHTSLKLSDLGLQIVGVVGLVTCIIAITRSNRLGFHKYGWVCGVMKLLGSFFTSCFLIAVVIN